MSITVHRAEYSEIASLRAAYRREVTGQIVHDSIHVRLGLTHEYAISVGDRLVGYGSVAVAGPWRDSPTVYEFYLEPEQRSRAFELFEAFLAVSAPKAFNVQSSDTLSTVVCLAYAREIGTEAIVFCDHLTTHHDANGATLRCLTSDDEIRAAMECRHGGGEWVVELDGAVVASGGVLFHYNVPYGDVYMDVSEPFRRRGIGTYLVQELKRICYELGAIPGARCSPTNVPSRRTLQRAGFACSSHILVGPINWPELGRETARDTSD